MPLTTTFVLRLVCVLWAFTSLALAQTSTTCDPTKKSCPANPALSSRTYTHDFKTGADDDNWNTTAGPVSYTSSGAEFTISKSGDHPTIRSKWYILFGRVSFYIRAAPGTGIVSSAILQSDDLDEVDWEWLGGRVGQTQSNYFGKGNTSTYDRAIWHTTADTQAVTRNYTITWTSSATTWYIDGTAIRTLAYQDALGGKNYPQTPMDVRIGSWAGGDSSNDEGTIEWAGGLTDYSKGPFKMVLEKIEVVNETPGKSYTYGDMSGSWESIQVGNVEVKSSAAKTATASSTKGSTAESAASATASATNAKKGGTSGSATETAASFVASATAGAPVAVEQSSAQGRNLLGWEGWVVGLMALSYSVLL